MSHEDFFLPLTKHDRNSLKDPTSHVLSYLPGLSVLSLSLPFTKWVAFTLEWELWAHGFLSEQEAPAACSCLAATPDGCQILPRGLSTQSLSLPAQAFLPQESQCQLFWPQQLPFDLDQSCCRNHGVQVVAGLQSPCPQRKTHELYHLCQITFYPKESL